VIICDEVRTRRGASERRDAEKGKKTIVKHGKLGVLLLLGATLASGISSDAYAETAGVDTITAVMTGSSSSGNDQVWVSVPGQLPGVPSSCVWNGSSLFYVPNDGALHGDKAMAALLSAKISGIHVTLAYTVMASSSDFWGFGITTCRIDRIAIGS
jgi:hypothetical protein